MSAPLTTVFLLLSVVLFGIATYRTVALLRASGRATPWVLIAAAVALFAIHSLLMWAGALAGEIVVEDMHYTGELVLFIGAILLLAGVYRLIPMVESARAEQAVRMMAEEVASAKGNEFLRFLVRCLGTVLDSDHAFVCERRNPADTRLATVALWSRGQFADNIEYDVCGTPCAEALERGFHLVESGVQAKYPQDALSVAMNVDSYAGMALVDSAGAVIGLLVAADSEPLQNPGLAQSMLRILADRAAAELDRQRVERALRLQAQLLDNVRDAVVATDLEATVIYWGKGAEALYGYPAEEMIGRPLTQLAPLNGIVEEHDRIRRTRVCGTWNGQYQQRRKDGSTFWAETTTALVKDSAGEPYGLIAIDRDITARKATEEALRHSEALYQSLVESLPQNIFRKDLRGVFTFVNTRFCQLLGRPAAQIVGRTDFALFPRPMAEKYQRDDQRVLRTGDLLATTEELVADDGRRLEVEVIRTPIRDARGAIIGIQGIFWDITERRALEEQLRQSQKMEAVGHLAGGVAHDFNNVLAVILGNATLLVERSPLELRPLLGDILRAGQRAATLVQQLLTFSRKMPVHLTPVDLRHIIHEVLAIITSTFDRRIDIAVDAPEDLWPVVADSAQVQQVVLNLCINARDALAALGAYRPAVRSIHIAAANVAVEVLPANLASPDARPGDYVCLSVADTGTGMTEEVRAHVFEPFFTTKDVGKGTGLGLATCYAIARQHLGWIDFDTAPGAGSTFRLYLPAVTTPAETNGRSPAAGEAAVTLAGAGETILLVDDEEMVRAMGQRILEDQGYRVVACADGVEAVRLYDRRRREIDAVILDMSMPRLSGFETLERLRALDPNVRVILSSGCLTDAEEQEFERLGVRFFVPKPFRVESMLRAVRTIIEGPAPSAARLNSLPLA